jgi:ATP-dependent Zn protease
VWFIGIAVVSVVIFGIVEIGGKPTATPYGTFLDQLDAGKIASATFQGTEITGKFKPPLDSAQKDGFRTLAPDFGDPTLISKLREQGVAIEVISSSQWTSWLGRIPWPILVFLGAILIAGLVRLMRGGKAKSEPTMPMNPMQGLIGLVSHLLGKRSQSAGTAAPDEDGQSGPQGNAGRRRDPVA